MDNDIGGSGIRAPSYNELITMLDQLRKQVEVLTAESTSRGTASSDSVLAGDVDARPRNEVPSTRPVMEIRMLPDLDKSVDRFTGRENSHQASDWLRSVNGVADLNGWPYAHRIQFVRANLEGAARDWFMGREFKDWVDFEGQFSATFVRQMRMSDRWDALRNRVQEKNEHVMDYFQSKVRLCRDLSLPFDEIRDHVIQGIGARGLAMFILGKTHCNENELLSDLLEWERMNALRNTREGSERMTQNKPREAMRGKDEAKQLGGTTGKASGVKRSWGRVSTVLQESGQRSMESKNGQSGASNDVERGSCFFCHKTGHISRDCPSKAKPITCFHCGVAGHIKTNCPNLQQVNAIGGRKEIKGHPYQKIGTINDCDVNVLLDTGSYYTLVKSSVAIRCGLTVKSMVKPLYGLGSVTVPSVETVGETLIEIVIDGVNAGPVITLVVPDGVQGPDCIVGRNWLDSPSVAYYKADGKLIITEADVVNSLVDTTVMELGKECDLLHVIEEVALDVREPLTEEDFKFVNPEVSDEERTELMELVNEYRDCFAKNLMELGCTPLMTMDINEVPGSQPIMCKPYKTSQADREEIAKIVDEWKRCGVVTETRSPYASPVLLVKQAGGKHRLCVDYRRLNKQTVRHHFPLPDMGEQLESLAASQLFTQLDLASGYLQIPLTPEASAKTAFISADTTGQFTRMPFGLSGAVAEFTRLMHHVLGPLRGKIVRNYLDDMVIDGVNWAEMLGKLRSVLDKLRCAKLTLKPSKCSFGTRRIEFLGFVVENGQIQPGLEKTRAIAEYPAPEDVRSLRRFLGLTGFFRRFVDGYAKVAEPLSRLTRKDTVFNWSTEQEGAFKTLKHCLTSAPILALFNPAAEITELHTDASAVGVGAMLLQREKANDPLRLVYCASKKTSDAEARYHSSKLELMCIVWAVQKLRQFLLGISFVVYTDCQALVYLNSFRGTNSQIARWHDVLQDFDFSVKYRPGIRMGHVDALSRAPVEDVGRDKVTECMVEDDRSVFVLLSQEEKVRMYQTADIDVSRMIAQVESAKGKGIEEESAEGEYMMDQGLLYRRVRGKLLFVMPKTMRKSLTVAAHDLSGHPALDRTVANIQQDFWFGGMKRYVKHHINMCFECLLVKRPRGKPPGLLHPIPLGKRPFHTVHLDHVGPFVTTKLGNKFILVLVDNLTKFVLFYAVRSTGAEETLQCVQSFVQTYGLPKRLISDRGTSFTAGVFQSYCSEQGIEHVLASSRHPQTNGQVERVHSVLMTTLMTTCSEGEDWDEFLNQVQNMINNSESKVTSRTPFELLHGYRPRFRLGSLRQLSKTTDNWELPEELRKVAKEQLELSKAKSKLAYDEHRHNNIQYVVGEIVVMKRAPLHTGESKKLQDRYRGPLVVTEVLAGDSYRVAELNQERSTRFATTAHVSQLKSWKISRMDAEEGFEEEDVAETVKETGEEKDAIGLTEANSFEEEKRPRRKRQAPVWAKDYV